MAQLGFSPETPKWWLINKPWLPVKLLYFFSLAAIGTLLPFITIFMKQLGLTSSETGIIYGVMPFVGFFFRPLIGGIADKLRQHKLVLMIVCFLTGVFYVCLLLVPSNEQPKSTKVFTSIHCNNQDSFISDCNSGSTCPISFTRFLNVSQAPSSFTNDTTCSVVCNFAIPGAYSTRVCFTSTVGSFPSNCLDIWVSSNEDSLVRFLLSDVNSVGQKEIIKDRHQLKNPKCPEYRDYDLKNVSFNGKRFWRMVCDSETILNCDLECSGGQINDQCEQKEHSYSKTFWIFFVIFLFGNIMLAPILSLADAIAYDTLGEKKNRWGKQRVWGTIGFATFAITSTLIMDALSKSNTALNYDVSFYLFGCLMIACVVVSYFLKISENLVCSHWFHNVGKLFQNPQILLFLITVFIFGLYNGVIEAFLFWYLRDLQLVYSGHDKGNAILMGLCLLLNCLAEAPFLFLSGFIIKRLGQVNCIYLTFTGYAVRFLGYSFLSSPWFVLFLEPLHGVTFGLFWAAASSYAHQISPPGLSATTQGLVGGLHFGFGKGVGSLITGFFFTSLGGQWSFRVYGISAAVCLLLSITLNATCFKTEQSKSDMTVSVSVPDIDIKAPGIECEDESAAGDSLLGKTVDDDQGKTKLTDHS